MVRLPDVVATALARHIEKFPQGIDGVIFTNTYGRPLTHAMYGSVIFKRAVKDAGLPPDTTPHDLRHHCVSVMLDAGESVVTVAKVIGDTPAVAIKVYAHMLPDADDRARQAIDRAWSGTGVSPDLSSVR